jgi:hypothetical protein
LQAAFNEGFPVTEGQPVFPRGTAAVTGGFAGLADSALQAAFNEGFPVTEGQPVFPRGTSGVTFGAEDFADCETPAVAV